MSVETRRKEREPKTETEKALMAQKTKEGLQGLAIGPVTGLLGLPSDIIDLANMANDAIAKYGADTTIAQFSKLIKPQLDAVQEKYGRDAFDKGFTELTGIKSDPTRPAQFLGELVSLGGVAKTGVKGAKLVGETISDTYKGAKKLFEDSTLPPPDNLAAQTVGATKPVDQLEQTKKLLDKEKAITTEAPNIIPPDEFINAPKTTRMSMAGNRTPTGKQQITKYRELDKTKKYNPDELFEMTGVYKGSDGEFRWEIDTTDAELKGLNIIKNAKDGDAVALSSILKFDRLYQEYFEPLKVRKLLSRYNYKPMKNVSVVLRKGTDEDGRALAAYTPSSDVITLYTDRIYNATLDAANKAQDFKNIDKLYEYQLESTLLHEIQHAIQGREGFTRGSATQNFIRSGYEQDIKTNNELLDQSYFRFFNEFESENALTGLSGRDRLDKVSNYVKLAFEENPNLSDGAINSIIKAEIRNLDRAGVGLSSVKKEQVLRSYFSNIQRHYKNKKILDDEYDTAYKSYRDVYGEKEANLVQKRFEERRNLRALMSMDTGQATKSDIEKVQKEMRQKSPPSDMMGLTRSERERQDVLARTDPITGKVKRKVSIKNLAKGGDMKKQMDLFQEGGLKDEGGTVDPVSGNDVPPGSTQEEVRDDIPAQLSEGEFVFPADVVRFIGLEKLMTLRQEAKAGLKRMEEMGQMGNSDEATLPDDMPFTIDDLDMEDEQEYNQGGVVRAQAGTFVAPGAGITTTPSQFTGQALPSATNIPNYVAPNIPPPAPAPLGGFRPLTTSAQTGQQNMGTTPTFQTLIGRRPGQYDEFREYVNEAGMKLQIPFKDGQPIYPIPEGYTFVDPEEEKVVDPKVTDVKPQTTRVTEESGDDGGDGSKTSAVDLTGAPLSYKSIFDMDKLDTALKDIAFGQLNLFDLKGATMRGITGNVDINNVTLEFQKEVMGKFKDNLVNKYGQNFNLASMNDIERNSLAESLNKSSDMVKNVLTDSNDNPLNTDDLISKANRTYGMSVVKANLMAKGTNVLSRSKITQLAKDMMTKDMEMKERSAKARQAFEDYSDSSSDSGVTQDLSDVVSDRDKAQAAAEAGFNVDETFGGGSAPSSPNFSNVSDDSGGSEPDSGGGYGSDDSGTMGGEEVAKGSLITKRKTSGKLKKKYMKRGGLASRK